MAGPQRARAPGIDSKLNLGSTTEIALLKEELAIKDARWRRLPSRRRPYHKPVQRMRILQLEAARGCSCEQAARTFLVDEQTLRSWMRRVDEEGERSLVHTAEPVNRFPDFVRYLVRQLSECTRRILVPITIEAMRHELGLDFTWFNEYRPSQALAGRTPREVHEGVRPVNAMPRLEPRPLWPERSGCASPAAEIRGACGARFTLVVGALEGREHLPVVELRRAA